MGEEGNYTLFTTNVGFGTDKELLYNEAEKMWLQNRVDVLVVVADFPVIEVLFPLADSLNRPLFVVNSGAKYPVKWEAPKSIFFLNLQEWQNSSLTGKQAFVEGSPKGIFATSFYDGGYSMSHAMSEAYSESGGEIIYNFVGKHLPQEFTTESLINYLKEHPGNYSLLTLLSGDLVPLFLEQIHQHPDLKPKLWANPSFLYELLTFSRNDGKTELPENSCLSPESSIEIAGWLSWWPTIDSVENKEFCTTFFDSTGRKATPYALLGWEIALLMHQLHHLKSFKAHDVEKQLKTSVIRSPRGQLKFDADSRSFLGPNYLLRISASGESLSQGEPGILESTIRKSKTEMSQPPQTGWINTYLCS